MFCELSSNHSWTHDTPHRGSANGNHNDGSCGAGATPGVFQRPDKSPAKVQGKRVSLRAYVVTSCVHCGEFWERVEAARRFGDRHSKTEQWIAIGKLAPKLVLPKSFSDRLNHQRYDGYVHVAGVFQYWPTEPLRERIHRYRGPSPRNSPDMERVIVEGSIHFGWAVSTICRLPILRSYGPSFESISISARSC
jgi:hypothetical protein